MKPPSKAGAAPRGLLLAALLISIMFVAAAQKSDSFEKRYLKTRERLETLLSSPKRDKSFVKQARDCAKQFLSMQKESPRKPRADDSLMWVARAYREIYKTTKRPADVEEALDVLEKIVDEYPRSNLADDAQLLIARITEEDKNDPPGAYVEYKRLVQMFPRSDTASCAKEAMARLKSQQAEPEQKPQTARTPAANGKHTVLSINHWSNPAYTRIAIYLDGEAEFSSQLIEQDAQAGKPRRLFVDLKGCSLPKDLTAPIKLDDGLLLQVRPAQYDKDTVRVVLDIKSIGKYNVFPLENPYRVIMDVSAEAAKEEPEREEFSRIIIDPGHGGKDPGAKGFNDSESLFVLDIGERLRSALSRRLPLEVTMTRSRDEFISLEGRTGMANKQSSDLFISIHLNASRSSEAEGLETYYLSPTRNPETLALVAAENAVSIDRADRINQYIEVGDLGVKSRISESNILADTVQRILLEKVGGRFGGYKDRGVRRAPFYVLVGAQMPAVLIEAGFITNPKDNKRLRDPKFRQQLADGIAEGIQKYIDDYRKGNT